MLPPLTIIKSNYYKREISLEYLTDEKRYPLGTTDEYFQAPEPDEDYITQTLLAAIFRFRFGR